MELVLDRREPPKIFSRAFFSLVVIFLLALFLIISSYSRVGIGNSISSFNRLSLGIKIALLLPLIVWSYLEILTLNGKKYFTPLFVTITLSPILFLYYLVITNDSLSRDHYIKYFFFTTLCALITILLSILLLGRIDLFDYKSLRRVSSTRKLLVASFSFWNSLLFVSISFETWLLSSILALVIANDVFAYLVGSYFGFWRISKNSPSKTLEGFIFVPVITLVTLTFSIPKNQSLSVLDFSIPSWSISLIATITVVIGSLGDLWFSEKKRVFNVKDYSGILGAHGGFWDRFDSHTFAFSFIALLSLLLLVFHGNRQS